MSFAFVGSYTPERPIVISSGYGADTRRPIKHKRYASTSATDDILRCQWRLNKVKLTAEGSVTLEFDDPAGIDPSEDQTASFSLTLDATAIITGADASVRFPTVLTTGDYASFTEDTSDSLPVTTTWGPATISVAVAVRIGSGAGLPLAISDTTFTDYYKGIELDFTAAGISSAPSNSLLFASTFKDSGYTHLGVDCDPLLHSSAPLSYIVSAGSGSVSFTTFKLERTDELAVP